MTPMIFITVAALFCAILYSKNGYTNMKKKLNAYQKLDEFAKKALANLNGSFEDISSILSDTFDVPFEINSAIDLYNTTPFDDEDIKTIMDYNISYNHLDIVSLKKATVRFTEFATQAYQKQREEYRKHSPALLCPPICALIVLILII